MADDPQQSPDPAAEQQPPEAAAETAELALAPTKASAAMIEFGQIPNTLAGAWAMAGVFAKSDMVPKGYRGKPYDILIAFDLGKQLGFTPTQALQNIASINGRPGVWGDGFLALLQADPRYKSHEEYWLVGANQERRELEDGLRQVDLNHDETRGVCKIYSTAREKPYAASFSIGEAKRAGLWTKRDTPWVTYPGRMLILRARGFAGRDGFAGALKGIKLAEELRDIPPDDVVTTAAPTPEPRRASQQATTAVQDGEVVPESTGSASSREAAAAAGADANAAPTKPPLDARAHPGDGDSAAREAGAKVPEPGQRTAASRFTTPQPQTATDNAVIVATAFLPDKSGPGLLEGDAEGIYEISVRMPGQRAKESTVFLTEDKALYEAAEQCTDVDGLRLLWHSAKYKNKAIRVLDSIESTR